MQTDGVQRLACWKRCGYVKTNGRPIANSDLWKCIAEWMDKCNSVVAKHVRVDNHCIEGNSQHQRWMLRALVA